MWAVGERARVDSRCVPVRLFFCITAGVAVLQTYKDYTVDRSFGSWKEQWRCRGASKALSSHVMKHAYLVELNSPAVALSLLCVRSGSKPVVAACRRTRTHNGSDERCCWCACVYANVGPSPVDPITCYACVRHPAGTLHQHTTAKVSRPRSTRQKSGIYAAEPLSVGIKIGRIPPHARKLTVQEFPTILAVKQAARDRERGGHVMKGREMSARA